MKTKFKNFIVLKSLIVLILTITMFTSCSDDEPEIPDGQGELKVELTDGPFPFNFATEANIGIAKIELRNSNNEYVTVFEGSANHNMIGLTNGVTANIETRNLNVGTYTASRITLNGASVHLSNGNHYDLNTQAAAGTYTVAINPSLVIENGTSSNVLFDLDINDSFSFHGMGGISFPGWIASMNLINGCNFNADFRVCDRDQTGTISGTVNTSGSNTENVQVYVTVNGHQISTHTNANGSFTFIGIAPGTYSVHANNQNGNSAQVGNVTVTASDTANCTITIN